ncbi:hypothetical protein ADUPG1_010711 [Aduncisulcus paluster]|uniref:Uncharacterized protein n=1 Tax=Aduncisulcus paluster TaxID=2918883 RepID=A0ABQ5JTP0_9EUKA|nr:hypothetical protein ADUPG1_010711 [Aduncisulcus paluster]
MKHDHILPRTKEWHKRNLRGDPLESHAMLPPLSSFAALSPAAFFCSVGWVSYGPQVSTITDKQREREQAKKLPYGGAASAMDKVGCSKQGSDDSGLVNIQDMQYIIQCVDADEKRRAEAKHGSSVSVPINSAGVVADVDSKKKKKKKSEVETVEFSFPKYGEVQEVLMGGETWSTITSTFDHRRTDPHPHQHIDARPSVHFDPLLPHGRDRDMDGSHAVSVPGSDVDWLRTGVGGIESISRVSHELKHTVPTTIRSTHGVRDVVGHHHRQFMRPVGYGDGFIPVGDSSLGMDGYISHPIHGISDSTRMTMAHRPYPSGDHSQSLYGTDADTDAMSHRRNKKVLVVSS